jgi:hypothetical protein
VYGSGIVSLEYSKEDAAEHSEEHFNAPGKKLATAGNLIADEISVSTGSCAQGIIPA